MFGLVDWSFIFTILVIMGGALVGSYLRSSHRDRVLLDFDGFHVTVETKSGRLMWGTIKLYPTGFELVYRSDVLDDDRHVETSYIFYKDEYPDIQAIYRYARDLNEEDQKKRAQSIERSFHPGLIRRALRSLRNFMSTATDSLTEALGMVLGRARKPAAKLMTDTSETYLKGMGKDIIGYVGTSYDPLLEDYVGTRVVMELVEHDEIHEHVGVMKEYSSEFLEMLDVYYPWPQKVTLKEQARTSVAERVDIEYREKEVFVENTGDQPLYLERLAVGEESTELDAILGSGEQIVFPADGKAGEVELHLRVASRLDVIVPRRHALIRHRAERYIPDTIFDIGRALVRRQGDEMEIEQLRQVLRYAPEDAIAAAKLGEQLFRQGDFVEAQKWLALAQERCYLLPDRGNRVAQNLRMLQRKIEQHLLLQQMDSEMRLTTTRSNGTEPQAQDGSGI